MKIASPYRTMAEAAVYLRYVDAEGRPLLDSVRHHLRRKHVPLKRRGRQVLVHVDDLDGSLEERQAS